jgi:hypothetical protein
MKTLFSILGRGLVAGLVFAGGCSVNSLLTAGTGATGCGSSGGYAFVLACDSDFGGATHQCTEYYSNLPSGAGASGTDAQLCSALGGTVLSGKCPTVNTLGSCSSISTSGSYGEEEITYEYASENLTSAQFESDCTGGETGTYAAPGQPPATPPGAKGGTCGGAPAASAGSGFSFSVETDLNGEPLECTNYFGVSSQATASVVNAGEGTTTPCPDNGKVAAVCDIHEAGPLGGTEHALIYYAFADQDGGIDSSSCAAQGGTFSATYSPP